jgi:hypothetical protein
MGRIDFGTGMNPTRVSATMMLFKAPQRGLGRIHAVWNLDLNPKRGMKDEALNLFVLKLISIAFSYEFRRTV